MTPSLTAKLLVVVSLLTAAILVLASCGGHSGSGTGKTSASAISPTQSTAFTTAYGQDAAVIASHIPGCTTVAAGDIGNGAATGMIAKATCTLQGHQVILYTWKDDGSESNAEAALEANGSGGYYAAGTGWLAILGDDTAASQAVLGPVASALAGEVHQYSPSHS